MLLSRGRRTAAARRDDRLGRAGRFRRWRRERPFVGALLTVLSGIELFLSGRLELESFAVQLGFSGLQSTVIPLVLVVLGLMVMLQPVHHVFYGVITLVVAVYSLVGVNLGGYVVGMLLGVVGGIVVVSWMGSLTAAPDADADAADAEAAPDGRPGDDPDLADELFTPDRDEASTPGRVRYSAAVALSVALVAGGTAGAPAAAPGGLGAAPCLLGILLCGDGRAPAPTPTVSPSPGVTVQGAPGEAVDVDGDGVLDGVLEDVTGDGVLDVVLGEDGVGGVLDGVGQAVADVLGTVGGTVGDAVDGVGDAVGGTVGGVGDAVGGAVGGSVGDAVEDTAGDVGDAVAGRESQDRRGGAGESADAEEADGGDGVTLEVPPGAPLPADEQYPVLLGGNEDVDVYSLPADLTSEDLQISGIRAVALVSVPVNGTSGERRNALKVVADRITSTGFRLKTYAYDKGEVAGTDTTAASVTMDGNATIYITSLTASLPDGSDLVLDADDPPESVTALLLDLTDPTVGLLGATSDRQVWSGFTEKVWSQVPGH